MIRWLDRVAALVARPLGAATLFACALVVYGVQAIAWPLTTGRDLDEYVYAYIQLFDRDVLLPWSLLFRTPITPILAGGSLDVAGGGFAEPFAAVLFAGSIVAWRTAGLAFGNRVGLVTAVVLLSYPGYCAMFHELSSETVFAGAFAGWAVLVARAAQQPTTGRFAFVGLGVAVLALVRPGNAVLLAFALFPLTLAGAWRQRLTWAAALVAAAIIPVAAWSVHNGLRFGEYSLARGGNAIVPFYRAFITDHIVSPDNGPASRRLGDAMQEHLLTREPYLSYGVTLDELFRKGSFRVHEDLYILSDQVFGWDDDYSTLRAAALEGVRAHPGRYASGVLDTVWQQLSEPYYRVTASSDSAAADAASEPDTVDVGGKKLPRPTEGEPIPSGQVVWISRPDQRIRQVWTSPTSWHLEFSDPRDRPRLERIERRRDELLGALPDRQGNAQLGLRLNQLSRWFPRPGLWIVAGLVGILVRRPRGWQTLTALSLAAILVVAFNALGLFADLHFMLPVAPAFVLLGVGGLLGRRSREG